MSIRNAVDQAGFVTFAVLLGLLWTVVVGLNVASTMLPATASTGTIGQYVGQTFFPGIVGLAVIAVLAGGLLYLASELGQGEPTAETFPPEE
ncbi:hypothetical protein [Halospeciosus flavus]|uniref:Cox cluster protein n=1 Tax=Halospeciosus flavus TaxID=3032283 RepID=A0ABD5Z3Z8_9EURY|nr:hypothetical protein [Halospeciosus flavus]